MLNLNLFTYSTDKLAMNREIYSLKICYKKHLNFIKNQNNINKTISNKLVKNSNYYYSFKNLNSFYVYYLQNIIIKKNSFNNSLFSILYKKNSSLNDINRMFLWVALKNLPIFKIKLESIKKKKYKIINSSVYFIKPEKRILIIWSWLNLLIKSFSKKSIKKQLELSFNNFLIQNEENSIIFNIKIQVYKLNLLRSL